MSFRSSGGAGLRLGYLHALAVDHIPSGVSRNWCAAPSQMKGKLCFIYLSKSIVCI